MYISHKSPVSAERERSVICELRKESTLDAVLSEGTVKLKERSILIAPKSQEVVYKNNYSGNTGGNA